MNTFLQLREVHKYTWYRPSMKQKSMINFCIVSADLFSNVLDVRVKRELLTAVLSTEHHLIFCSADFETCAEQEISSYKIKWEA